MASSGSRMLTGAGVADDARPNGRASSLIRMWRELEAEAGAGFSSNHHCEETAADAVASDGSGWMDGSGDWTSDAMTTASSEQSSSFTSPPSNGIDQSRVGNNENKAGRVRTGEGLGVLSPRRLRGRGETQSFMARMEQDRRRELAALADRRSVSRFAHRGRLQSMLKLRSLERQAAVLDRMRCFPSRMDSDRPYKQSTISFLRNPIVEVQSPAGNGEISATTSHAADVLFPVDAESSGSACTTEQFDGSSQSIGWHSEGADEGMEERYPQQNVCGWVGRRRDSAENFTDNVEIRELLDRRRVSTSLASDFSDKMNKLILSFIRRRRAGNCFDRDFAEATVNRHQNSEQIDSVSSSLGREAMHELRSEMARIHEEIQELRQMVESCMEWQGRLEQTIKQDILDAVHCFL